MLKAQILIFSEGDWGVCPSVFENFRKLSQTSDCLKHLTYEHILAQHFQGRQAFTEQQNIMIDQFK